MKVVIDDPEFDEAVKELVAATGETEFVSLKIAVKERLDRVTRRSAKEYMAKIREITSRVEEMPVLDARSDDEIIGYNEHGCFDWA
jgi:antitoxin VapB